MDTLLTHRNQIREPIHHNSQPNINSSRISKLRVDILSKIVPNFNLTLNHKRVVLPSLISILAVAAILNLVLIIAMAIVLRKMDRRTIISQVFRIIRLPIALYHIFPQNLSSQMPISHGPRIRMYHACRQHRSMVISDAVILRDQLQGNNLRRVNQVLLLLGNGRAQTHHRSKAECSKYHWSILLFADTVIA